MMKRRFKELREQALAGNPERAAHVERLRHAMETAVQLAEIRERRGSSQRALAGTMNISQARVSQIEHTSDPYLSTLSGYVEALGGHLRVAAVFPEETIDIRIPVVDDEAKG